MSRGASLHDIFPLSKPPQEVPEAIVAPGPKHPQLPNQFAIKVRSSFFTDGSTYAWSPKAIHAKKWTDRSIPDGIVERWKKAKDPKDPATLNGVVLNTAEVVDVTDQWVPVSDLWDHFN